MWATSARQRLGLHDESQVPTEAASVWRLPANIRIRLTQPFWKPARWGGVQEAHTLRQIGLVPAMPDWTMTREDTTQQHGYQERTKLGQIIDCKVAKEIIVVLLRRALGREHTRHQMRQGRQVTEWRVIVIVRSALRGEHARGKRRRRRLTLRQ